MTNRSKLIMSLNKKIDRLLQEAETWRTRAERVTPYLTGMPSGGHDENPRELAICRMVDCETEANYLIEQLRKLKRETE